MALAEGGGRHSARAAAEAGWWRWRAAAPGELAETLVENLAEEFQRKEDEPWHHPRDLQLAAEWEDLTGSEHSGGGFSSADVHSQSGAATGNEHLTKQVGLLWQMNEQHAKAYDQLHVTAGSWREQMRSLLLTARPHSKTPSQTETIKCLQANIDHLQSPVEFKSPVPGGGARGNLGRSLHPASPV